MKGREIRGIGGSARGMYMRNTADILQKWKNVRRIADIPKLSEIGGKGLNVR